MVDTGLPSYPFTSLAFVSAVAPYIPLFEPREHALAFLLLHQSISKVAVRTVNVREVLGSRITLSAPIPTPVLEVHDSKVLTSNLLL